jgi:hypothetical protein
MPSLVQRRRRPFDPLASIIGFSGGNLADQLDDDTKRRLTVALGGRPEVLPLDGYEQPPAAPQPAPPLALSVRPAIIPPQPIAPPVPAADLGESLARQLPPPQPVAAGDAPPMVDTRGRKRPARIFIGDGGPEEREQAYADKVREFQPEKESKKHLALRTLLNFVANGIPGAAGTLLGPGGVMDRRGVDRAWQQDELAKATTNLGGYRDERRQGLQDRLLGAQVGKLENPPPPEPDDVRMDNRIVRRMPDGSYKEIYTAPDKPQNQRPPLIQKRTNPDGTISTLLSYDQGKTWGESPELTSRPAPKPPTGQETPRQTRARVGQFRAAKKQFDDYSTQEQTAAAKKDAAFARASTLRDWQQRGYAGLNGRVPESEDVEAAEKTAQAAQAAYESYAEKKTKAQADMLQYGELGEDGQPREPQAAEPLSRPAPATHSFSIAAYIARNPGATEADARAIGLDHRCPTILILSPTPTLHANRAAPSTSTS